MNIAAPASFEEALELLRSKNLVPTELSSAGLRGIAAEVKAQALFSARLTQLRPLQALQDVLDKLLSGEINLADATYELGRVYADMGYDAEKGGFPSDVEAGVSVPAAARGSLRDLASEKRKRLTITTNYRMAANAAFVKAGATDVRAYQFPCYELVRIAARRTPRGFVRRKGALTPAPGQDWPARFIAAGGELFEKGTRMIAAKGSDVWIKLGEGAGGYQDTLGNPYPPFAFGSGYGLREVAREEALLIGVPFEDRAPAAKPMTLKADAKKLSPAVLAAFKDLELRDKQTVSLSERAREEARAAVRAYQLKNRLGVLCALLNGRSARVRTALRAPVDRSAAAKKGWQTRRANGWRPQARPGREVVQRMKQEARAGADSLRLALSHKRDVADAMITRHGKMDFIWGRPGHTQPNEKGETHTDGYGISHIHAKRGDAAMRRLPVVLARGRMLPHEEPNRRILQYGGWSAVIEEKGRDRWNVITLIDDLVYENPKKMGQRGGGTKPMVHKPLIKQPKNKAARHPGEMTGPTTKVDAGEEHPGPTHTAQRLAKDGVVASKDSRLTGLHARCKAILGLLQTANREPRTANAHV